MADHGTLRVPGQRGVERVAVLVNWCIGHGVSYGSWRSALLWSLVVGSQTVEAWCCPLQLFRAVVFAGSWLVMLCLLVTPSSTYTITIILDWYICTIMSAGRRPSVPTVASRDPFTR